MLGDSRCPNAHQPWLVTVGDRDVSRPACYTVHASAMSFLSPCPHCRRHVRVLERVCPFCLGAIDLSRVPAPVLPTRRLGRAALFAFGATIAAGLATSACGNVASDTGSGESNTGGAGSGGASADASFGGTGSAIYGCGPFGTGPNGLCNVPESGAAGASGNGGSAGTHDSGLAGSGGAAGVAGSDAGSADLYGLPPDPDS